MKLRARIRRCLKWIAAPARVQAFAWRAVTRGILRAYGADT